MTRSLSLLSTAIAVTLGALAAGASAQPVTATKPAGPAPTGAFAAGSDLPLAGNPTWPRLDWLYDRPSMNDAAGKAVVHWFCAPKVPACVDDLARIINLRDSGKVYVIAYINGTKVDAKKLDPIRESEGIGRGTLAFGPGVAKLMKDLGVSGPASIVVGADGKVQVMSVGGQPADLDARDAKVNAAAQAIKDYTSVSDGAKTARPGEKFPLSVTVTLASWLKYSSKTPRTFAITMPRDIKCDSMNLSGDQIKVSGQQLTAQISCSGPHGVYEGRGDLRFGYDAPTGGTGLGAQMVEWKFEVK
ncbi:MAG TPA: hypothetical protein VGC42_14230 [Kofleriaceae bacterium]